MAECLFSSYAKNKKRERGLCSTFLFCFSLSNSIQHKARRKSLSGSMFILEERAFGDDRWPQVDNDDDLIRSLSLVWSQPKLLHPADGINLATVKKSRAIFCSFLPPLPPPSQLLFLVIQVPPPIRDRKHSSPLTPHRKSFMRHHRSSLHPLSAHTPQRYPITNMWNTEILTQRISNVKVTFEW